MSMKVVIISAYLTVMIKQIVGGAYIELAKFAGTVIDKAANEEHLTPGQEKRLRKHLSICLFIVTILAIALWPITMMMGSTMEVKLEYEELEKEEEKIK